MNLSGKIVKSCEKFYIFYDDKDFVKYCGTAKELVAGGYFKNIASVYSHVAHIKDGEKLGVVVIFKGEKYSLIRGRKRKLGDKKPINCDLIK